MLYRTNILALVGGGPIPAFPPNTVVFWDDHAVSAVGQLAFPEVVLSVKLRRDKIVVVTMTMVYIYNFDNFDLIAKHPTAENPYGICALSSGPAYCVLATLAKQTGHARIENYTAKKSLVFKAHESGIRCMTLSSDGSILATCSGKGTIIRIFDTYSDCSAPLQELRRGSAAADVYSLAFNRDASMICTCSDHGTLHVFCTNVRCKEAGGPSPHPDQTTAQQAAEKNQRSRLSFASSILPKYFSSEWSFAQFKGPDVPSVCAFGSKPNSIILLTCEGEYFELLFDKEKGGPCVQGSYHRFKQSKLGPFQKMVGSGQLGSPVSNT
jgi:WD40 repeat protein